MNPSTVFRAGALLTATGISTGAFGSHGLRSLQPPLSPRQIESFHTASQYLIYNGLALLATSFHPGLIAGIPKRYRYAPAMILSGTILFSGSIFALVLAKDKLGNGSKILGPTTPLGGLVMIAGYIMLAI